MLLKLAALLAAISHTLHDTLYELRADAAEHQRCIPLVKRMRADKHVERVNKKAVAMEEAAQRLARVGRVSATRNQMREYEEAAALEEVTSKKANKLDAKALSSAAKRAKAQAILDLIRA